MILIIKSNENLFQFIFIELMRVGLDLAQLNNILTT